MILWPYSAPVTTSHFKGEMRVTVAQRPTDRRAVAGQRWKKWGRGTWGKCSTVWHGFILKQLEKTSLFCCCCSAAANTTQKKAEKHQKSGQKTFRVCPKFLGRRRIFRENPRPLCAGPKSPQDQTQQQGRTSTKPKPPWSRRGESRPTTIFCVTSDSETPKHDRNTPHQIPGAPAGTPLNPDSGCETPKMSDVWPKS